MNNSVDFNHPQVIIDPLRFLELEKTEILYKLTNELGYSEEESCLEFHAMTQIIVHLKPIRNCQSRTDDYLMATVKVLRYRVKLFIVMILLRATEHSDPYSYAHNSLVYYANRYLRTNFAQKRIPEHELLALLEAEKETTALEVPIKQTERENPLVFDETLLNGFYLAFDHCIWEHAPHASFMNWFRVNPTGKPVFRAKMTAYFCYAVSKIESRMIGSLKPKNLNRWIEQVINGNNYSALKKRVKNKKLIAEIDTKLALF